MKSKELGFDTRMRNEELGSVDENGTELVQAKDPQKRTWIL